MQIVIDISEDVYTRLFDNGIQDNEIAVDDICEMARSIRKGKLLPKGHGRLIDADAFKQNICTYQQTGCGSCKHSLCCPEDAPTIIEADKGVEE